MKRRAGSLGLVFLSVVFLHGSRALLEQRMASRRGHFMPPSLLDSQLATLEPLTDAISIDVGATPEEIVRTLVERLGALPAQPKGSK